MENKEKKRIKQELINFVVGSSGGVFMAWFFYKMYTFFNSDLGVWGWIFVLLSFFVGSGLANTINKSITKINK